jgi:D-alanyl-D-alanine carboxypeptidase
MVKPARTAARRVRSTLFVFLLVVGASLIGVLGYRSLAASLRTSGPSIDLGSDSPGAAYAGIPNRTMAPPPSTLGVPGDVLRGTRARGLGEADGVVPEGTTVFDDRVPAIAKLDPGLLAALRRAATDAAAEGVEFVIDSGWRSRKYQEELLRQAISQYGSEAEAARWVATPDTSPHVTGDAVDIGHADATSWLSRKGASYGLCQIYRNEPWHFELRPAAAAHGCPPMYADPTHDPRMRQ